MQAIPFEIDASGGHTIHGTFWHADNPGTEQPLGVVQLFHGLGEHHLRYARFANEVTKRGLAFVAHDHRGHGEHAPEPGYFADANGWQLLASDGLLVNDLIKERFPDTPVALMGHSMGSYVAQNFVQQTNGRIQALVLSASTWQGKMRLAAGAAIARVVTWQSGPHSKSPLLHRLGFGNFNKPFEPARTELDWLSRDEAEVDAYIADPLCGGPYTCRLWQDLIGGLQSIMSDVTLACIPSQLPILLTGGADDPVGGDRGITKLAMHYAQTGHNRIAVKIYPGGRHEMLNETNRDAYSADVVDWIVAVLPGALSKR